jgi:O-antigen/teichoic acid export membrane protein
MLTIIGLVNIGIGMFGNPLNNARLIDNKYYIEQKGDYNIFLSLLCLLNTVFIFVSVRSYDLNIDWLSYLLLLSISIFSVVVSYLEADYRIHLNYKRIMFSKIIQTSGYGLGCLLFAKTKRWEWIFFIGYGLNLVFVFATTSLWKEPFRITSNIRETTKRIFFLELSSAIGSILTYVDRLIIFPIFGGTELSIYYAASIVGKTVLMVTSPLASVLLSYSVRLKSISRKQFFTYILILLAVAGVGYVVCFLISDPLISLLYPDCLAGSKQYIPWTVAASMLGVIYSFVWPLVLRFGKNSYPSLITIFKAVVYVLVALLTVRKFGIMGICYANLLSTGAQVLVVIILGFKVCDKKDN